MSSIYWRVWNVLLATYAKDAIISESEAKTINEKRPEHISDFMYSVVFCQKSLLYGHVYEEKRDKEVSSKDYMNRSVSLQNHNGELMRLRHSKTWLNSRHIYSSY